MTQASSQASHSFSLVHRTSLTFALVGGVVLVLSLLATRSLFSTRQKIDGAARRDVPHLLSVAQLQAQFYEMRLAEQSFYGSAQDLHIRRFVERGQRMDGHIEALIVKSWQDPNERQRLIALKRQILAYRDLFATRRDILSGKVTPEDPRRYQNLTEEQGAIVAQIEEGLQDTVGKRLAEGQGRLAEMSTQILWTLGSVLLTLLVSLGGLALLYRSSKRVARRIANLAAQLDGIRSGEVYTVSDETIDQERDEVTALHKSLRELQGQVHDRTEALSQSLLLLSQTSQEKDLFLQHVRQGLVTLDLAGKMSEERSAVLTQWLGPHQPDTPFWECIEFLDLPTSLMFHLGWQMLVSDILPLELALDQMPKRIVIGTLHLRIDYEPLMHGEQLERVMLMLTDVSAEVEKERLEAEQRELLSAIDKMLSNRDAFRDFFIDAGELVRRIASQDSSQDPVEIKRMLHTLKGNSGIYGLSSLAAFCHEVETRLQEEQRATLSDEDRVELTRRWSALSDKFGRLITPAQRAAAPIEISEAEFQALCKDIEQGADRNALLSRAKTFQLTPVRSKLEHFADQIRDLSKRLGKAPVDVHVETYGVRLCPAPLAEFWSAFTHVVRNAADHGLEFPEERQQAGKPEGAVVHLRTHFEAEFLSIEVADDGRGIDWQRLRERAEKLGMPAESEQDLCNALFADGVSTRKEVSELSGRGVGLGAVKHACESLGGQVLVESTRGQGTLFRFLIPKGQVVRTIHSGVARPNAPEISPTPGPPLPRGEGSGVRE